MPALVQKQSTDLTSLTQLKKSVSRILLAANHEIESAKIKAYWLTGRDINEHLKLNGGRADYGSKAIDELSSFVGQSASVLEQCARFASKFPDFKIVYTCTQLPAKALKTSKSKAPTPLFWSHFRALLSVEDDRERFSLADQAYRHGWTVDELEARIHGRKMKQIASAGDPPRSGKQGKIKQSKPDLLKPRIGKLHTYRILPGKEEGWPRPEKLLIDHGFRFFSEIQKVEDGRKKLEKSSLISNFQHLTSFLVKPGIIEIQNGQVISSSRTDKDLYFYRAYVKEVIDGDTFWAAIDLDLGGVGRQKLRLRGIDAKEIALRAGKKAARFLKALLTEGLEILIRTSPSPTYDRFEADAFCPVTPETQKIVETTQPPGTPSEIFPIEGEPYYFVQNILLERGLAVKL